MWNYDYSALFAPPPSMVCIVNYLAPTHTPNLSSLITPLSSTTIPNMYNTLFILFYLNKEKFTSTCPILRQSTQKLLMTNQKTNPPLLQLKMPKWLKIGQFKNNRPFCSRTMSIDAGNLHRSTFSLKKFYTAEDKLPHKKQINVPQQPSPLYVPE